MIYDLILIVCVTINGFDGQLISKNCDGRHSEYYTNMEKCTTAGKLAQEENIVRSFHKVIGAAEKIESHKCIGLNVQ